MSFLVPVTICILLCAVYSLNGQPTNTVNGIINYLAYNEYENIPSVYFLYPVDNDDFQTYIKPFTVAKFNNQSYIVLSIQNLTAYYDGAGTNRAITFTNLQSIFVYTIVEYEGQLNREILTVAFNFTPPAIVGNLYQSPPYNSYLMDNYDLTFQADNETGTYHFSSTLNGMKIPGLPTAAIDVTVQFNNTNQENLNYNDVNELVGFYLSSANNRNGAQSHYQKNGPNKSSEPVLKSSNINITYTQVNTCVNFSVSSNYIQELIGKIKGLDEMHPAACFYVPYTHFFTEPALPTNN